MVLDGPRRSMDDESDEQELVYDSDGLIVEGDEDEEGEEGEEDQDNARDVLDLFEDILRDSRNYGFDRPEDFIEFENKFRGQFDKVNPTYGTLLHFFVSSRMNPPPPILLGKWLVKRWPGLVKVQDSERKTPIHLALEPKTQRFEFVELVLDDCPDAILATALAIEDNGGRNCLHHAIYERFRSTLKMIKKCNPDTFVAKEKHGQKTPLLIAMDLDTASTKKKPLSSRATPKIAPRPRPVAERKGGDEEMDHKKERLPFGRKLEAKPEPKDLPSKGKDASSKPEDISKGSKLASKDLSRPVRPTLNGQRKVETDRASNGSAAPMERFNRPEVVQYLMEHSRKSLSVRNSAGQTPYQYRLHLLSKAVSSRYQGDLRNQDLVARGMKEFCLRELGRDEAIEMLYEKGKEKHIEFDLSSLPTDSISRADLDQLARHLTFEDTLRYVALPKLHIEDPKDHLEIEDGRRDSALTPPGSAAPSTSGHRREVSPHPEPHKSHQSECSGLSDASIIFQWLWDNNVRRIFRVVVIDDGDPPHSNQVIEEALVKFQIEVWDWKKIDMDSETIYRAAKDARIVYLYTSGNSAVLRGWACESGLVKLEKLQRVNIIIRPGFETETRRGADLKDFEKSFLANWDAKKYPRGRPVVEMIPDDKSKSYASWFQNNQGPEEKQKWLVHMDTFASFITSIDVDEEKMKRMQDRADADRLRVSEAEKPKLIEDIRVALIDDGIDGFESKLSQNIAHGVSFCRPSDTEDLLRTYYVSSGGHGTMMARLIRRMCPRVKLYVARLEDEKSSSGKRFITARSARQAIDWAITNEVHIISMSWTIESTENDHDIQELKKSIDAAKKANITMLCAFSDQGNNAPENTFPGFWKNECWTIGAATSRGDASTLVDKNRVDFLFPGEQIIIDPEASAMTSSSPKPENGSSISTALAAGTAALLLFITQLVEPAFYTKLREPDRLKKAFEELCAKETGNPKYFAAQNFNLKFADADWNWENEGRKQVGFLVESFMSKDERSSA